MFNNFNPKSKMNTTRAYHIEILNFYEYVWEFYNEQKGIYPIANDQEILNAVNKFLESKSLKDIDFDSIDRENVRKILQTQIN